MKKQQLFVLGGLLLVAVFIMAGAMYKGRKAKKTAAMAKAVDSPLNRAHAMSQGPEDAKVVIVEFFDPGCETCREFSPRVKAFLTAHPDKIRLVKRYAPFHHGADKVSQILEAARLQGKYWETLDVMFARQPAWASHHNPQPDMIWQYLPAVGLDIERLRRDMNDPKIVEIVRQDMADAETLGVHKTPSFFVNGKKLQRFGHAPLKALIESEIAVQYPR